jgi:predicted nucleic acid-binding protein
LAIVADSGGIFALYDRKDRHHTAVRLVLDEERSLVVIPSAVLGELDYLLRQHLGIRAEMDFVESIMSGSFTLENLTPEDVVRCHELISSFQDLDLGLADAAVIATAERLNIHRVLTVDERDFRAVRPKGGRPFLLLPADGKLHPKN